MKPRSFFSQRNVYLVWLIISALFLLAGYFIDPYVFGIGALGAGWVSFALVVCSLLFAPRRIFWALLGGVPAAASIALASTFNWA